MKKFKIFGFDKNRAITITNTANSALSPVSTFDETISKKENRRETLNFSIYKNVLIDKETMENPFLPLLYQNAKLRYEDTEFNEITDFIITSISYTITKNNIKYTVKAEDYASQVLSKRGQDMEIDITGDVLEVSNEILKLSSNAGGEKEWKLDPSLTEDVVVNKFPSPIDSTKAKKITLTLSNTNMYNAFVEMALLFDASLDFDYVNKYIKIKNKQNERFNGFRLRPEINLSSIGVSDSVTNFTTAMHVVGDELEDENGIKYTLYPIPNMPFEVKRYFTDCIDNNFIGEDYFENYSLGENTYISKLDYIMNKYKLSSDNEEERREIVKEYLQLCDLFPHLENTLYDIYYFYTVNAISKKQLDEFYNFLNNEVRKSNIKIKLYSERYYEYYVKFSVLQSEIEDNIEFLTAEELYRQELIEEGKATTDEDVIKSDEEISAYKNKIESLVKGNEFILSALNIYGKTETSSGFDKLIADYDLKKEEFKTKYEDNNKRIAAIDTELKNEEISDTSSQYIILTTEKAGLEKSNKKIIDQIGTDVDANCGTVGVINHWINYLEMAKNVTPNNYIFPSTYDLIIDQNNPNNLIVNKKKMMSKLYQDYDNFIIETTYTNTDERSSYNLAEQAYLTFYGDTIPTDEVSKKRHYKRKLGYNTPTRSFNLTFIDLSVLEEYNFLTVNIGDTVELNEPSLDIKNERVRITSINYNLRDAGKTQLGISLVTEEQNILQKLLLNL